MGAGSAVPCNVMGQRPPSACEIIWAPISCNGSRIRRIGRLRSEASPSKVARMAWPPTTPIIKREPVPALPKSRTCLGAIRLPRPMPSTVHFPSPWRVTVAPKERQASPVRNTSSPSSKPEISVLPTQSNPKISERCEMLLSPGGFSLPFRPEERLDDKR